MSGHTNDAVLMREGKKVCLIGVNMSDLNTHGAEQLQLFDQPESKNKDKVAQLLDTLGEKFGEDAAARASLVGERSHQFLGAEEVVKPKKKNLEDMK